MRRTLFALLLLAAPALAADPPGKPNPLVGTWARETEGTRVLVALGEKRVSVTLHQAMKDDRGGKVERLCLKLDADYATGPDGRVFGVVTGADATGTAGMMRSLQSLGGNLEEQLEGMPFAIRMRIDDGVLSLSGLRVEGARGSNYAQLLTGKFRRADDRPLAKLKPAKAEAVVSGMTLPSPHYLQHYPTSPAPAPIAPAGFGGPPPIGVMTPPSLPTRVVPPEELPPIPILPLREEAPKPRASGHDSGLPSPHYLQHPPTYFPPDPPNPHQRERDSMLDPTGEIHRGARVLGREEAPTPRPVSATAPKYFPLPSARGL